METLAEPELLPLLDLLPESVVRALEAGECPCNRRRNQARCVHHKDTGSCPSGNSGICCSRYELRRLKYSSMTVQLHPKQS